MTTTEAGTDPATTAAPAAGADAAADWRASLPEDLRADPVFANFRSLGDMAHSFKHAQSLVGLDKLPLPKDDAKPELWDEVYRRLGRPDQPDQYGFARPDTMPEPLYDQEFAKRFAANAHKYGLSTKQAKALHDDYVALALERHQKVNQDAAEADKATERELRAAFGDAYDTKVALAQRAFERFGKDIATSDAIERAMKSTAGVVRLFAEIGAAMGEDGPAGGRGRAGFALSPDEAKSEIAALNRDKDFLASYTDRAHPAHADALARMTRLYAAAYPEMKT